jgi:hypothetical protein
VVEHFGREHWFGEDGAVFRGGEEGELPILIAKIRPVHTQPSVPGAHALRH